MQIKPLGATNDNGASASSTDPLFVEVYDELVFPNPPNSLSDELQRAWRQPRNDWHEPNYDWDEEHIRLLEVIQSGQLTIREQIKQTRDKLMEKQKEYQELYKIVHGKREKEEGGGNAKSKKDDKKKIKIEYGNEEEDNDVFLLDDNSDSI